jgi:hypothetical protein
VIHFALAKQHSLAERERQPSQAHSTAPALPKLGTLSRYYQTQLLPLRPPLDLDWRAVQPLHHTHPRPKPKQTQTRADRTETRLQTQTTRESFSGIFLPRKKTIVASAINLPCCIHIDCNHHAKTAFCYFLGDSSSPRARSISTVPFFSHSSTSATGPRLSLQKNHQHSHPNPPASPDRPWCLLDQLEIPTLVHPASVIDPIWLDLRPSSKNLRRRNFHPASSRRDHTHFSTCLSPPDTAQDHRVTRTLLPEASPLLRSLQCESATSFIPHICLFLSLLLFYVWCEKAPSDASTAHIPHSGLACFAYSARH